ncbi:carbohydrate kinase family protein [Candidatus Woesearchaeota archaeon]|nr:carbohydrate kinase family protein [Candidatus Woesearchaeota archaeon]
MYDVITVGSATVDVFADSASELIKIKTLKETEELIAYPSGSKILIKNIQFLTGGGGTNTAVALARLGHKVAFLGNLGKDANAKIVLEELEKNKVDFIGVKDKGMTGFSVVLKSLEHDRSILAYKGVNNDLTVDEVNFNKLKTKWFYFSSMMDESFKTMEKLAEFAEKNHIMIAFNPSNYLAEKGTIFLRNVLTKTTYLILNTQEAELLVGKGEFIDLIKKLMDFGPKLVVITDGKRGAHTFNKNYYYHIIPSDAKVFETTGAGDSFAASFLSGMIKKNDVEFALRLAQINAESVIQHTGAKNKLLTYKEALGMLKKTKLKIKKRKI